VDLRRKGTGSDISEDPNDMEDKHPIGMSDDLQPIDRAMLLALSHRQRNSTPLSLDQERLLDSWVAGRLLECRLIAAANEGPRHSKRLNGKDFESISDTKN
jgi:hypothetical protein